MEEILGEWIPVNPRADWKRDLTNGGYELLRIGPTTLTFEPKKDEPNPPARTRIDLENLGNFRVDDCFIFTDGMEKIQDEHGLWVKKRLFDGFSFGSLPIVLKKSKKGILTLYDSSNKNLDEPQVILTRK
jgi:hypothetical protein